LSPLIPFEISPVSSYRVYANDDPLFFGGTIEPFDPSCVDEPVKEIMIDVIEFVVLVLYVQNHITPPIYGGTFVSMEYYF
jgi:hypothetical protein